MVNLINSIIEHLSKAISNIQTAFPSLVQKSGMYLSLILAQLGKIQAIITSSLLKIQPYLTEKAGFIASELQPYLSQEDTLAKLLLVIITIGTINWTIWLIRRTRSVFYKPMIGEYYATTSVIIPVYNEKEDTLFEVTESILSNKPDELILVLDHTEKRLMHVLNEKYRDNPLVRAVFIEEPGKRPALAKGIRMSRGDIVVLVDSDTTWASKDFLKNLIIPFKNPKVGGVGSRQRVKVKKSNTQKIIDFILDVKYTDFVASDSLSNSVLCLSGRTAAYRREAIFPVLDSLVNEHFLWHRSLGGDDVRLTSLVLKRGYKTVYQSNAIAETDFEPSMKTYLKQKIRWSRNSFRAYIKNIFSSWPWSQGRYYYLMSAYHTIVPGITALFGFVLFFYSLYLQQYAVALLFFVWIFISRIIKSFNHLRKRPKDIALLPEVVGYFFILSFIKLYALLTMTHESWSGSRKEYKLKRGVRITQEAQEQKLRRKSGIFGRNP